MSFFAVITMIFVGGIVWGGMITFLTKAIKYEKIKEKNEQNSE